MTLINSSYKLKICMAALCLFSVVFCAFLTCVSLTAHVSYRLDVCPTAMVAP